MTDMRHQIETVDDAALPNGCEWLMVQGDHRVVLFVARSKAGSTAVLEEAWAGYRRLLASRQGALAA